MYDFTYLRPNSIDEAASVLSQDDEAKLLAGGMTLLPTMKQRLASPSQVLDLSGLKQLNFIRVDGGVVEVGAMTRHADVAASDELKTALPALADLAGHIGDPQVRNRGTLGGSIANNDPSADYPGAVLALDAEVVTNKRSIPADNFFTGLFETALDEDEIITSVRFKRPKRAAYVKFPNPASRYAVVGAFVAESDDGVRVAITGAGPCVFRWSEAEAALGSNMATSALEELEMAADDMNSDLHATAEYRAHLVKVMTKRAVEVITA
ncbi:MAG: xanthine dehydrogenase family protein subunit M [Sphingomonadales bacterium]|jgi:carbon-monoxide dehydrogenase medium subunit